MGLSAVVGRWWERVAGIEAGASQEGTGERKTSAVPMTLGLGPASVLMPFRVQGVTNALPKPTAMNLRRLAETPAARRAINCIKDRIACMDWRVEVRPGAGPDMSGDRPERAARLTAAFAQPNAVDSFRTVIERLIEDTVVGGFGGV